MSLFTKIFGEREEPPPEVRSGIGLSDPAFMLFGGMPSLTGVEVTERTALGVSAVWCAVRLIANGVAKLPLAAVSTQDGVTQRVDSWLDSPGFNMTKFELLQTATAHLLLHGNAYLAHVYNNAGTIMAVQPIHPIAVSPTWDRNGVATYQVTLIDGTVKEFDDATMTHVKGLSLDGRLGLSPLVLARNGMFGTSIAADRSAASLFGNGALVSTIVTPEDTLTEDEATAVKESLTLRMSGTSNAGDIAVINRKLKFQQWSMSNQDAQWLESRAFQVQEVSRWFGIPATLIALNEKQSSWGTGIAEMHQAMVSWTLADWTGLLEGRLSMLLPKGTEAKFDFHDMLTPDPEANVGLIIQQVDAGLLTPNEARQILNRQPVDGGDKLRPPNPAAPPAVHNEV